MIKNGSSNAALQHATLITTFQPYLLGLVPLPAQQWVIVKVILLLLPILVIRHQPSTAVLLLAKGLKHIQVLAMVRGEELATLAAYMAHYTTTSLMNLRGSKLEHHTGPCHGERSQQAKTGLAKAQNGQSTSGQSTKWPKHK